MPCVAEMAWTAIKRGSSLHAQANLFGIGHAVLDRAIWAWRAEQTRSGKPARQRAA